MTCSVLILARNEEKNMKACIESCQAFASEVIVIDDHSTDATREICESLGAKVIERSMNGDWGAQQTFAIEQASHDWIFFIDADERCTPELAQEIAQIVTTKEYFAYWVKRLNHFKGKRVRYGALSPDWVARLLPREGSYVTGFVHPKICFNVPEKKLSAPMLHFTYETWAQYEGKMNKYSTLAAKKYASEGKQSHFVFDIVMRPLFAFIKMYFLKRGFMDGVLGLAVSRQYANYTMAKYFKLYELNSINKGEK